MPFAFVLVKPDGVSRGLVPEVVRRFEASGLKVKALRFGRPPKEAFEALYAGHAGKPFFSPLVDFMSSGPVAWFLAVDPDACSKARALLGPTDPSKAPPGTIRGDLGISGRPVRENVCHASDGPEAALREARIFYRKGTC